MELTQLKITKTVITTRYGTLSDGDVLRTDPAFARHLVDDCRAAKYMEAPQPETQPRKTRKGKK